MNWFRLNNLILPGRLVVLTFITFILCGVHVPGDAAEKAVVAKAVAEKVAVANAVSAKVAASERAAVVGRLKRDLRFLSSDEMEGRGVGTGGLNVAADYIRKEFQKAGLDVTRVNRDAFYKFTLTTGAKLGKKNALTLIGPKGKRIALSINKNFRTCSFGKSGSFNAPVIFCGYGIDAKTQKYQDFKGVDVKGKVVILIRRTPGQKNPHSAFGGRLRGTYGSLRGKYRNAFRKGAVAVLFVNDSFTTRKIAANRQKTVQQSVAGVLKAADLLEQQEKIDKKDAKTVAATRQKLSVSLRRWKAARAAVFTNVDELMKFGYGGNPSDNSEPIFHISQKSCNTLLQSALKKSLSEIETEIDKTMKPHSAALKGWRVQGVSDVKTVKTEVKNVIGVLEGEGPLADETIVIGAHYDHVGYGKYGSLAPGDHSVHNGADDNASGTVSLLELARRLAARKKKLPRRIVFIAFTAEELGLIGSAKYTAKPVFPLKKTIAMFNMDMVGRLRNNKLTIFGIGTAPRWKTLVQRLGKNQFKLTLKPEGFGPSDQSSFYAKKIPVLHFFTDTHRDYHRPSDDWEKINFAGMSRIVDMIETVIVKTAEKKERPKYLLVKSRARIARSRQGSRPYFGVIPSFGSDAKGCEITGTSAGGPAQKAGLKGGDVIVQLGPHKIGNLEDFDLALRKFKPGKTVIVTVLRKNKPVKIKVTLAQPR